ncbi:hypothetical protein F4779DRAFT_590813 [Xylariaceae sp. FL0662B]|nr:hypothetical protein F4779DRAFT_590813 [Xylariaceae sp. FL0662B]
MATERPLSPWAKRFAVNHNYVVHDGYQHSALAPQIPSQDPKYYADNAPLTFWGDLPGKPSLEELDRLFFSERLQSHYFFRGLLTWQIGALNDTLEIPGQIPPIPSGHKPADDATTREAQKQFYSRLAPVEEDTWFRTFRRDRWLGWPEKTGGIIGVDGDTDGPDGDWNARENNVIWGHLRHSIGIADRVLKALMDEDNDVKYRLKSVLYPNLVRWADANPSMEPDPYAYVIRRWSNVARLPLPKPTISRADLARKFDESCTQIWWSIGPHVSYGARAVTCPYSQGRALVVIGPDPMRALGNPDATIAEKCLAYFDQSLIHALLHNNIGQHWDDQPAGRKWEPSMNFEPVGEIGLSFENELLGMKSIVPPYNRQDQVNANGLPMLIQASEWPTYEDWNATPALVRWTRPLTVPFRNVHVPTAYTFWLQSQQYWTDKNIVKTSGFKFPAVFTSRAVMSAVFSERSDGVVFSEAALAKLKSQNATGGAIFESAAKILQMREKLFTSLRPWWLPEFLQWQQTPWSYAVQRTQFNVFSDAFKKRDEAKCRYAAIWFIGVIQPDHDVTSFVNLWLIHSIGLLMMAALPVRRDDRFIPAERKIASTYLGVQGTRPGFNIHVEVQPEMQIPTSRIFHANLSGTPLQEIIPSADRRIPDHPKEYLDAFERIIRHFENAGSPFPRAWITEAIRVHGILLADRSSGNAATASEWATQWPWEEPWYSKEWVKYTQGDFHDVNKYEPCQFDDRYDFIPSPSNEPGQLRVRAYLDRLNQMKNSDGGPPGGPPGGGPSGSGPSAGGPPGGAPPARGPPRGGGEGPSRGRGRGLSRGGGQGQGSFRGGTRGNNPRGGRARGRGASRSSQRPDLKLNFEPPYPIHLSIGTVANHGTTSDAWVLDPDADGGFDVYDISGILSHLEGTPGTLKDIVWIDELGRHLQSNEYPLAKAVRAELGQQELVGKLLYWRTWEEIAERNGQNGTAIWIAMGRNVYDISNFDFRTATEQSILTNSAGGVVTTNPDAFEPDLLERLRHYRCALTPGLVSSNDVHLPKRVFTPKMLAMHDNPSTGQYMAIDGLVYEIGGYKDFHPGGTSILEQFAGKDATKEFYEYHSQGNTLLHDLGRLVVGKLVPQITIRDVQSHQIVIDNCVFDLSELINSTNRLSHLVQKFGGQDVTPIITGKSQYHTVDNTVINDLVDLSVTHKDHIVARVAEIAYRQISTEELRRHNDADSVEGAWVAVGGEVYNVTFLIRHPKPDVDFPTGYAGLVLPRNENKLALWLRNHYRHYLVGFISSGRPNSRKRPASGTQEPSFSTKTARVLS